LILGTTAAEAITTPLSFSADSSAPEVSAAATILQQLNDGTVPGRITIPAAVNAFFASTQQSGLVSTLQGNLTNIGAFQTTLSAALPSIITSANYSTITSQSTLTSALATASAITPDQALWNMRINVNLLKSGQAFCTVASTDGYWVGPVTETVNSSQSTGSCAQDLNSFERALTISPDCSVTEQAFRDVTLVDGGLSASGIVSAGGNNQVTYAGKYPDSTGTGNDKYTLTWTGTGGISGPIGSVVNLAGTFERNTANSHCVGTSTGTLTKTAQSLVRSSSIQP
jgi:hypothetical protein